LEAIGITANSNKPSDTSNANGNIRQTEQSLWHVFGRLLVFLSFLIVFISTVLVLDTDNRSSISDWLMRASLYLK